MTQQDRLQAGGKVKLQLGLPVYNGEEHLEAALKSIQRQTYSEFELLVSDNASTDRTAEICQDFAAGDDRIRYYRNSQNLGLVRNFNRVFDLSDSEYFAFVSHDDDRGPTFLQKCVAVLDEDPSVALAMSQIMLIDDVGRPVAQYDIKLQFPNEMSALPHERFRDLILIPHMCIDDYGVMRSNVLRRIKPLYAHHDGNDRNMLAEMSLYGKFYHVPETLFFWRDQRRRDLPFERWAERLDTSHAGEIPMPRWQVLAGYLRTLQRVPLEPSERARCYAAVAEWVPRHARGLGKDVWRGGRLALRRAGRSQSGGSDHTSAEETESPVA
jgi:glycosyltransferase involved in cell wall biosynthesis